MSMMTLLGASFLMQEPDVGAGAAGAIGLIFMLVWLAICVFFLAVWWKIFSKAGEPGWAILVPIYNIIIMNKIIGKGIGWLFFAIFLFPIWWILWCLAAAEKFGKSTGFAVGMMFLGIIFLPILAFGDAQYQG